MVKRKERLQVVLDHCNASDYFRWCRWKILGRNLEAKDLNRRNKWLVFWCFRVSVRQGFLGSWNFETKAITSFIYRECVGIQIRVKWISIRVNQLRIFQIQTGWKFGTKLMILELCKLFCVMVRCVWSWETSLHAW